MFTQTQNEAALATNAPFTQLVTAHKALLAQHELPFTVDVELIKSTFKARLFEKLLAVDKGLKMRFAMLKTNEARLRLVSETVDLEGYEEVPQLEAAVKGLETAYKRLYFREAGFLHQSVPFAQFAEVYELELATWLGSHTYDWSGKEHVLAYFEELGTVLEQLREVMRAAVGTSAAVGDVCHMLQRLYGDEKEGPVAPDQGGVMRLVTDLERAGKLDLLPAK